MKSKYQIIVTGASGFIGSNLIAYLISRKFNVIGYYRNISYRIKKLNIENYCIKVKNYKNLPSGKWHLLIHLAAESNRNKYQTNFRNIKSSTLELCNDLIKSNFHRVLFLSSSEVYKSSNKKKITEKGPINHDSNYAKIKFECEEIFNSKRAIIIRASNIYGPNMGENNIFYDVINQISKKNLNIYIKDIFPVRDFLHVYDLSRAIELLVLTDMSGTFNVGSGRGTSIKSLAQKIINILSKQNHKIISLNQKKYTSYLTLNSDKIKKKCKWRPKYSLNAGLKKVLN